MWLTQEQMSKLFGKAKSTINEHIKNVYREGELIENETMTKFGNSEFSDKPTNYYNLDMIISIGYRVKSQNGILFRKWDTSVLKDYMLKRKQLIQNITISIIIGIILGSITEFALILDISWLIKITQSLMFWGIVMCICVLISKIIHYHL